MLQQSRLQLEFFSFSSLMFVDNNDGSQSYTDYYLVMYVGTFKKVGLSLIEKSITEELRGTMEEVGETV